MYCKVNTGGLYGLSSYIASVEVDVSRGLPAFEMVGLLGSEIKEARERIRVALKNTQTQLPPVRITVNISPADIHKAGTSYDLPVALGILAALEYVPVQKLHVVWTAGELGLLGEVKPVRGILPMVMEAEEKGLRECILPLENLNEACMGAKIPVMGVRTLEEAMLYLLSDEKERTLMRQKARELADKYGSILKEDDNTAENWDMCMIRGMAEAKRAALIAAAGQHNLFLTGPPGTGKTLLAKCIPSILPPLTQKEQREVSAIYSVAGKLPQGDLIRRRPFVDPHHTVTVHALAGGGNVPKPGMISLAHRGVLFLDEMAEFKRTTLDILRQPLESGTIYLAKGGGNFVYPADFMLVGAANPCPCGYYPDRNRCRCTEYEVHRYFSKISGPLLDRFDLFTFMESALPGILWEETDTSDKKECSRFLLEKVLEARQRQKKRYQEEGFLVNSRLGPDQTIRYCRLGMKEQQYLERAAECMQLSIRACHRVLRVARTIADLDGSELITIQHLGEAFCYRRNENDDREVH